MEDTIVALATAAGKGGIAIVRLSGDNAVQIADKLFQSTKKIKIAQFQPYLMYTGWIDCHSFKDYGLAVYFKAPKSFTGEDTVELHCHGGTAIAKAIIKHAIKYGARLAEKGEYTKRAFLNGKMSLAAVEGLVDMINGESEAEVRAGAMLYAGNLTEFVQSLQEELTEILASIEADIDFPEEDIEATDLSSLKDRLFTMQKALQEKIDSYSVGKKMKEGVRVVLAGKPNAGKSALLNALLQEDRAIVSSVAGTTRDIIQENIEIQGVKFSLIDTAGLRRGEDEIEKIGIERAKKALENANIILYLIDSMKELSQEDYARIQSLAKEKLFILCSKIDCRQERKNKLNENLFNSLSIAKERVIEISTKTGENLAFLREKLYEVACEGYQILDNFIIEERHCHALKVANAALMEGIAVCGKVPPDILGIHLKEVWQALGEITGETANERIITEIFTKFCVGK